MTVEAAIRSMLLADPAVAALVGDRVYLWQLPEPTAYPAVTHFLVSEVPVQSLAGLSGSCQAIWQVSCWATDASGRSGYSLARSLAQAVRAALVGQAFTDADSTVTATVTTEDSTQVFPPDVPTDPWHHAITLNILYTQKE